MLRLEYRPLPISAGPHLTGYRSQLRIYLRGEEEWGFVPLSSSPQSASQAQNYIRCIIVSSIISISSLSGWHYTGQVKPQLLKFVTSIKLLYNSSSCYHWSGSLSSAGVAAVGVDHADEARRLAPRPLAHHHHVHAAQEEAVIETVRPETM